MGLVDGVDPERTHVADGSLLVAHPENYLISGRDVVSSTLHGQIIMHCNFLYNRLKEVTEEREVS